MARKILGSIFPTIFLAAGLFFLFKGSIPLLLKWIDEQSLSEVEGTLINTNLGWTPNDSGEYIYTLSADYKYEYKSEVYTVRVEEKDTYDSSYHYIIKRNHEATLQQWEKDKTRVFHIDPANPGNYQVVQDIEAVFWILMIGLPCIFITIGGYLLLKIFTHKEKVPEDTSQPWLVKPKWKTNTISCSTVSSNRLQIIGTIFWNLIAFSIFSVMASEQGFDSPTLLIISIFPLIGVILFFNTYSKIWDLTKNGKAHVILDPYPASIGGHFGGSVHFKHILPKNSIVEITLNCLRISQTGNETSDYKESLVWQTTGFAYVNEDFKGANFRFDIPEDLKPSSLTRRGIHWNVVSVVSYDNEHFTRQFQIPVYETNQKSQLTIDSKEHPQTKKHAFELINDVTEFREDDDTYQLKFPNFRILKPFLTLCFLLGLGLLIAVFYNLQFESLPLLFNVFAGFFGIIFLSVAMIEGLYTLRVQLKPEQIIANHSWFGIPIKSQIIDKSDIEEFKIGDYLGLNNGSGRHRAYYKISVIYKKGYETNVAIRLKNITTAEQMKRFFERFYKE